MNIKKVGKVKKTAKTKEKTYPKPEWVKDSVEEELCPDCFKVVGSKSRYQLVCILGKEKNGLTVTELTSQLELQQPTITHHLNVLRSVDAVTSTDSGRERIYTLNRDAHCFDECKIPF
jgi:predicted transcriptional regulator